MDLLVVFPPAWLLSTKQWFNIDLPLGFWHIQGYRFASVGVEISPIKLLESILGYHWFTWIKIQLTVGYLLKIPKHSVYGL